MVSWWPTSSYTKGGKDGKVRCLEIKRPYVTILSRDIRNVCKLEVYLEWVKHLFVFVCLFVFICLLQFVCLVCCWLVWFSMEGRRYHDMCVYKAFILFLTFWLYSNLFFEIFLFWNFLTFVCFWPFLCYCRAAVSFEDQYIPNIFISELSPVLFLR